MAGRLLALACASLTGRAAALLARGWGCPPVADVVATMTKHPGDALVQRTSCSTLGACVPTNDKQQQDAAAAAGVIEASVAAMERFPDDEEVQLSCIGATVRPILFNRENGLRAGRLGGLNLTLKAYKRWMSDPRMTSHGGDIGCYLDYCDENRDILRELGGVHLLIQNIKNNFHGEYSNWGYEPVKNSLFGLSSGCWKNADLCHQDGFVQLSVQLMNEHTSADKIAEESLQAVKAMAFASAEYSREFSEAGIASVIAKVLKENPNDRGAISVACEAVFHLVGPASLGAFGKRVNKAFSADIQARATRDGLLQQLLATAMSGSTLRHKEHSGFNFDIDASYNADALCLQALGSMGYQNGENTRVMLQAGLTDYLVQKLDTGAVNSHTRAVACAILSAVNQEQQNTTSLALAKGHLSACSHPR